MFTRGRCIPAGSWAVMVPLRDVGEHLNLNPLEAHGGGVAADDSGGQSPASGSLQLA